MQHFKFGIDRKGYCGKGEKTTRQKLERKLVGKPEGRRAVKGITVEARGREGAPTVQDEMGMGRYRNPSMNKRVMGTSFFLRLTNLVGTDRPALSTAN
jgi:hypothetical protein